MDSKTVRAVGIAHSLRKNLEVMSRPGSAAGAALSNFGTTVQATFGTPSLRHLRQITVNEQLGRLIWLFLCLLFRRLLHPRPSKRQLYLIPIRFSTAFSHNNKLMGRRLSQLREPSTSDKVSHHLSQFTNASMLFLCSWERSVGQPVGSTH